MTAPVAGTAGIAGIASIASIAGIAGADSASAAAVACALAGACERGLALLGLSRCVRQGERRGQGARERQPVRTKRLQSLGKYL
eukprot:3945686-Pleurochrysis_carterae.AAC.2